MLVPLSAAFLLAVAVCSVAYLGWLPSPWILLAAGVFLGASLGFAGAHAVFGTQQRLAQEDACEWAIDVRSDERASSFSSRVTAQATSSVSGETYLVEVSLPAGGRDDLLYGDRVVAWASPSKPAQANAMRFYRDGVAGSLSLSSFERAEGAGLLDALSSVRASAIVLLGQGEGEAAALAQALACGYRESLRDGELYAAFKATGLAHMVAVSGAHLSIVSAFFAALLAALRCPRIVRIFVQGGFILAYLALTAAPVSAIRAALMAVAGMSAFFARRRTASMAGVGACVLIMLVASPQTSVSVSFFLSAASTLGIVALSGLFESWFSAVRMPFGLASSLALTCSASVATTPVSAALFSQLPLIAPVANLVAAPLLTLACVSSLAGVLAALAFPPASALSLGALQAACGLLAAAVEALSSIPYACIPASLPEAPALIASIAFAVALWAFWPRLTAKCVFSLAGSAACALALCLFAAPRLAPDQIVMLDVGQGDAFVVRSRGSCVLIDTGNSDAKLLSGLARHGIYRLDAVVISHADDDHCASLDALRGVVRADSVALARDALSCTCASCTRLAASARDLVGEDAVSPLSKGDVLRCGNFSLRVIAPESFHDEGGNADSLCLLAEIDEDSDGRGDFSALFCGDAESDQLSELVGARELGKLDVYKVGHHGSRAAITPKLASVLAPSVSLVSVGASNRYGHPVASTLSALEEAGSAIFRTDEQGDVSCEFTARGLSVSTLR